MWVGANDEHAEFRIPVMGLFKAVAVLACFPSYLPSSTTGASAPLCLATENPIISLANKKKRRVMPCSGGLIAGVYICERGAVHNRTKKKEEEGGVSPVKGALHGS